MLGPGFGKLGSGIVIPALKKKHETSGPDGRAVIRRHGSRSTGNTNEIEHGNGCESPRI